MAGAPSAHVVTADYINVFSRSPTDSIAYWVTGFGWGSHLQGSPHSDPAATSWGGIRWDVFSLNVSGVLERTWSDGSTYASVDLGLTPPLRGEITAISRERGSIDVIGETWHVIWPRDPAP